MATEEPQACQTMIYTVLAAMGHIGCVSSKANNKADAENQNLSAAKFCVSFD